MTQRLISTNGQKNIKFTNWEANTQYRPGDMVVYNSAVYTTAVDIPEGTPWGPDWTIAVGGGGSSTGIVTGTGAQDYQVGTFNPTTRSDGSSALEEGDLWYDTSSADLKIWSADIADWALVVNTVPPSIINGMSSVQASPSSILFVVGGLTTMSMTSNGLELKGFTETVTTPAFNATFAPNVSLSSIIKFTATSNFTFNGFTSPVPGQSATIIVTQDATGSRLMTSTMKFTGGVKTLSTAAGAIDIISVFYDGAAYYASLTTAYA